LAALPRLRVSSVKPNLRQGRGKKATIIEWQWERLVISPTLFLSKNLLQRFK
jgi:hypothetical protein